MVLRKTLTTTVAFTALSIAFVQGCGKVQRSEQAAQGQMPAGGEYINADVPGAQVSDVLMKIKGRWIREEISDMPNPSTMRMYASANNTLTGRLLIGGAFEDTGVLAELKQEGDQFTLTLTDDDLRPHDYIPPVRVLKGTYNASIKTLRLQSDDRSEFIEWSLPGGYSMYYSGQVYRCITMAGAEPASGSIDGSAPPDPSDPNSNPSGGSSSSGGSASTSSLRSMIERFLSLPITWAMAEDRPSPGASPGPPVARHSCGIMNSYKDLWSRMSNAY